MKQITQYFVITATYTMTNQAYDAHVARCAGGTIPADNYLRAHGLRLLLRATERKPIHDEEGSLTINAIGTRKSAR